MQNDRYPKIHVRSKNELAKHLADRKFTAEQGLELINDVTKNFDLYWKDHKKLSKPLEEKWVRDASFTRLGTLLKMVNQKVLAPYDHMVPNFVFGGLSKRSHKMAVAHLLGVKRGRVLLKLDIRRFYEQISKERVEHFFATRADCGKVGARMFANLACVQFGAKDQPQPHATIARGFSTSSRLAVWCNLDTFMRLEWLIQKELKGKDPRIAIYVDDIGITASRVSKEEMMALYPKIKKILERDKNQPLPLNDKKTKIIFHAGDTYSIEGKYEGKRGFEHLGIQMNRNDLTLGTKTRWKRAEITHLLKTKKAGHIGLKKARKSLQRYKAFIES